MRLILVIALALGFIACGGKPAAEGSGSIAATTTTTTPGYPLVLKVSSVYESGPSEETSHVTCSVPTGSASGTSISCSVNIPELQLFYSKLLFEVESNVGGTCEIVTFRPYYFVRSTSATYNNGNAGNSIDCSGATAAASPDCWGGAGPKMVTGFPGNVGMFFYPALTSEFTYTLSSSYSYALSGADRTFYTNVMATNNLVDRATAISAGNYVRYVSNSMVDYNVSCLDKWYGTIYQINLTIGDEDTTATGNTPGSDERFDWGGL